MDEPRIAPPGWSYVQDHQAWVDFWLVALASVEHIAGASTDLDAHAASLEPRRVVRQWLDRGGVAIARNGDWSAFERSLGRIGERAAVRGASLGEWHELTVEFKRAAIVALVKEHSAAPERLTRALLAVAETASWTERTLSEAYFRASQQALAFQKGLAEKRAAELEVSGLTLRQQASILETAVNGMRDGVWVCDEEGRHLLMNHAAEAMVGPREPGAMIVNSVDTLYAEDGVTPLARDAMPLARALRGEPTDDVRAIMKTPGHEPVLVLMHGRPLRDASGRPCGGVSVIRDITAIERLSQHSATLEQENERVRASNRLRNQFMANMSHELRTPLNAVIGFAELMREGKAGPMLPQQREILGDILTSGRHLLDLINDLLDLAKVEAGKMPFKPELFDLRTLVDETCSVFRAAASPQRVDVVSTVNEAIGAVMLDPTRVRQVLYNYLSNAVKFTTDGGHIVVRAEPHGDDAFVLEVEDDGVGIEFDDQRRLFTPYQQLDRSPVARFGGTGLGLALTRRIVEAQGGSVGVRSTPGAGSVFRAILPRMTTSTRSGSLVPPRNEPRT